MVYSRLCQKCHLGIRIRLDGSVRKENKPALHDAAGAAAAVRQASPAGSLCGVCPPPDYPLLPQSCPSGGRTTTTAI